MAVVVEPVPVPVAVPIWLELRLPPKEQLSRPVTRAEASTCSSHGLESKRQRARRWGDEG